VKPSFAGFRAIGEGTSVTLDLFAVQTGGKYMNPIPEPTNGSDFAARMRQAANYIRYRAQALRDT
jgi:hypothetical protein